MRKTVSFITAVLLCMVQFCTVNAEEAQYDAAEWEVLYYTNAERLKADATPLTAYEIIMRAGDIRAEEITREFSHTRPDGSVCFTALDEVGAEYSSAGENIAAGHPDAYSVVQAWMKSSGHRANILDKSYGHLGAGFAKADDDYGYYWVQLFTDAPEYVALSVKSTDTLTFPVGTSMQNIAETFSVAVCAETVAGYTAYMPLMAEFCSGYDANVAGVQTVTVNALGLSCEFQVTLTDAATVQMGDVTGDGIVNTGDAVAILKFAADMSELDEDELAVADVVDDDVVNTGDAVAILKFSAGLIDGF